MSAYDEELLAEIKQEVAKLTPGEQELVAKISAHIRTLLEAYDDLGLLALSMVGVEMSITADKE